MDPLELLNSVGSGTVSIYFSVFIWMAIFLDFYGSWCSLWNRIYSWTSLSLFCFGLLPWMMLTIFWPQDLKDFVRTAGEVTYADTDRAGNGYQTNSLS